MLRLRHTVVLSLAAWGCAGRHPPPREISYAYTPAELAVDVRQLRAALEEGAASLYRYRDRPTIDSLFGALGDSARRPMTALDFWRVTSEALAQIGDAHLTVLPNQPVFDALYTNPGRALPLRFAIVDGRLYVLRNYLPPGPLPVGSEILAVNGSPVAAFLERCGRHISTDGNAAARRDDRIERDVELTCALAHSLPAVYRFTYRAPGSPAEDSTEVRAIPWRERRVLVRARAPGDTLPPPRSALRILDDRRAAVLTITSFSKDDSFDPEAFFDSTFRAIANARVTDLIIDVRGNRAGRDGIVANLFSRIATDTFSYATRTLNKRRYQFLKGTDDWTLNYMSLFISMRRQPDGRYRLTRALDQPQRPAKQPFTGRVYVLAGRGSFSAGAELVVLARRTGRATIIGEETASAFEGGSGATASIELRCTRLVVNVPLVHYDFAVPDSVARGRGVMPDIPVRPTIDDLLAGRDAVLDAALALIASRFPLLASRSPR